MEETQQDNEDINSILYSSPLSLNDDDYETEEEIVKVKIDEPLLKQYVTEFKGCVRIALPMAITYILGILLGFIEIIYLSHLGTKELAAAGLGVIYCNGSGFSFGIGMLSAFDTLASQAFGTKSYKFSYYFLILLGQDPDISLLAQVYTRWNIFGIFPFFVVCCFQRYCQNQSIIYPIFITALFGIIFVICGDYLLVYVLGMGFKGAPIMRSINNILSALLIWAIVWGMGLHKVTWGGWSMEAFQKWVEYFKLGIPGIVMVCAEWWGFEMNVLFAGLIDTTSLDAMSILVNIFPLFYMVPYSISIGASTRIGNHLGAAEPSRAQMVCRLSLVSALCLSLVYSSTVFLIRNELPYLFTDDKDVASLVTSVLPYSCILLVSDSLMAVAGGILRGSGLLVLGASVNIGSFYLFGIPCGLVLTFIFDFGLLGLILGLLLADVAAAIIFLIAIVFLNWDKLSKQAIQRIRDLETPASSVNLLEDIELDEYAEDNEEEQEDGVNVDDLYNLENLKTLDNNDKGNTIDIDDIPSN